MLLRSAHNVCSICSQRFRSVSTSSVTQPLESGRSAIQQAYKNRNLVQAKLDDLTASRVRRFCKSKHLSINSFLKQAVHSFLSTSQNG